LSAVSVYCAGGCGEEIAGGGGQRLEAEAEGVVKLKIKIVIFSRRLMNRVDIKGRGRLWGGWGDLS
jgi:hypothetical protein